MSVAGAVSETNSNTDVGLGRAFLIGSLIGFVAVFFIISGATLLAGMGLGPALGAGLFAAFWAGPGMGGMMGGVSYYNRTVGH